MAMKLYGDMQLKGLSPGVNTYTALIKVCEKGSKVKKAIKLHGSREACFPKDSIHSPHQCL